MGVEGGHADVLPPLYARWASEFLGGAIAAESAATCNDCAMLSSERGTARPAAAPFFNPDTKCCTYLPVLPNFLVGRMLADDSPEFARGRVTLETRLTAGVAVSSLGIGRDAAYDLLYVTRGKSLFGQARSMRCPHYLDEGAVSAASGAIAPPCARRGSASTPAAPSASDSGRCFIDSCRPWKVSSRCGARASSGSSASGRDASESSSRSAPRLVEALHWRDVERICGPDSNGCENRSCKSRPMASST